MTTFEFVRRKQGKYPVATDDSPVVREVAAAGGIGQTISVRAAKAHLSALLDLVCGGSEVVITSHGEPKVKLVGFDMKTREKEKKVFKGAKAHLKRMTRRPGPTSEQIMDELRAERW